MGKQGHAEAGHVQGQCCRDVNCGNHKWEHGAVEVKPSPIFFGHIERYITFRCCGKGMLRCRYEEVDLCTRCGFKATYIVKPSLQVALCTSCERKIEIGEYYEPFPYDV
jgi:hypothetical protein